MKTVPKRAYTLEFRDVAVRQVLDGGRSIASVAHSLEMSSKSLANWGHQARKGQAIVKRAPTQPMSVQLVVDEAVASVQRVLQGTTPP
ncbi:MAG: transposase [Rubrivivax sp.]|nr:transposase [Rubrivivax sp.]